MDEYTPDTTSSYPRFNDVMTSPAAIYGNAYPETQLQWEQRGYPAHTALHRKFAPEMPLDPRRGVQPTASLEQRLAGMCGCACKVGPPAYTWHQQRPCRDNYCNCCNGGTATEMRWCLGNKSGSPQPSPTALVSGGRESFTVTADSPVIFWFFIFILFVFMAYICRGIDRIIGMLARAHPSAVSP